MSMDYQAEDQAFHEEVAREIKGMAFTSFTGNVYVDAIRTLKSRADEAYQRGVRAGKMLALIQCADLAAALPNEVTVTDYNYRNGWRDACSYAEMCIRALEVKP